MSTDGTKKDIYSMQWVLLKLLNIPLTDSWICRYCVASKPSTFVLLSTRFLCIPLVSGIKIIFFRNRSSLILLTVPNQFSAEPTKTNQPKQSSYWNKKHSLRKRLKRLFKKVFILHRGVGHKVPVLISKIRIFATNTATAANFGDFS